VSSPQTAEGWVLKLARERSDLSASECHLLITLAARHNRDYGAAHPKLDLLHKETHLSTRQIVRLLNALTDEDRPGGQVLHISFGPLPIESRTGHPVYGNVYRFVGFDEIPETARPRRRDVVDSRPSRSDTTSHTPGDTLSLDRCDTGEGGDVTPGGGSCDTGDANHVTPASSPLYPVKNPVSIGSEEPIEHRNPDLNPVRVRAQDGIFPESSSSSTVVAERPPTPTDPHAPQVLEQGGVWCEACRRRYLNRAEFNAHLPAVRRRGGRT
jgi:hypothetical protein